MNLDPDKLREVVAVELPMLGWLAIHGNLCLALRHPQNAGESRGQVLTAVRLLSTLIVEQGIMSQTEMDHALRVERQAGSLN
jgi:hypothetical protein